MKSFDFRWQSVEYANHASPFPVHQLPIYCLHACLTSCACVDVPVRQVCDREGRARYAREALRSSGLPGHGGALDEAAGLLPEAEADQQPLGPVRTRRCLGPYHSAKAVCGDAQRDVPSVDGAFASRCCCTHPNALSFCHRKVFTAAAADRIWVLESKRL